MSLLAFLYHHHHFSSFDLQRDCIRVRCTMQYCSNVNHFLIRICSVTKSILSCWNNFAAWLKLVSPVDCIVVVLSNQDAIVIVELVARTSFLVQLDRCVVGYFHCCHCPIAYLSQWKLVFHVSRPFRIWDVFADSDGCILLDCCLDGWAKLVLAAVERTRTMTRVSPCRIINWWSLL